MVEFFRSLFRSGPPRGHAGRFARPSLRQLLHRALDGMTFGVDSIVRSPPSGEVALLGAFADWRMVGQDIRTLLLARSRVRPLAFV